VWHHAKVRDLLMDESCTTDHAGDMGKQTPYLRCRLGYRSCRQHGTSSCQHLDPCCGETPNELADDRTLGVEAATPLPAVSHGGDRVLAWASWHDQHRAKAATNVEKDNGNNSREW